MQRRLLLVVGLLLLFVRTLLRSPWGRVLRSIREDEDAARALGKNVFAYKLQSLMIGGAIGGLSGILLAFNFGQVNPDTFLPLVTFFVWAILILGGSGSLVGPVAGSVIFWIVINQSDQLLRDLLDALNISFTNDVTSAWRFIIVGTSIALLMVFRPQGLYGKKEELLLEIQ